MKKLFIYTLAAMLAIPAIDLMSKPDTDKDKIAKTTKAVAPAASSKAGTVPIIGGRKPKKGKTLKSDKRTLKRKYTYRKGARQL